NAALLQPYSHIDTDRWVYLSEKNEAKGLQGVAPSIPNFLDWRRQNQSFSDMVFWTQLNFNLSGSGAGEPERVRLTFVRCELGASCQPGAAPGESGRFTARQLYRRHDRIFGSSRDLTESRAAILARRFGRVSPCRDNQ